MKKLMIALAVAASAVMGNAASVNWNSAAITLPDGSAAGRGSVVGYLFVVDKTVYDTFVSQWDSDSGKDLSDLVYAKYGDKTGEAYAHKISAKSGTANITDDSADYAGKTAYAVILYTTTQNNIGYYMGNIGSATVEGAMDVDVDNMGKVVFGGANATATAWSSTAFLFAVRHLGNKAAFQLLGKTEISRPPGNSLARSVRVEICPHIVLILKPRNLRSAISLVIM